MGINFFGVAQGDSKWELAYTTGSKTETVPVNGLQWSYKIYGTGLAQFFDKTATVCVVNP